LKIFAVSDIHGFFKEFKSALDDSGFQENNQNHLLVCCGDYWDRGIQPLEVMNYLNSISNKILVKGNHEDLLIEMLERGYPLQHDKHNGTYKTYEQLLDKYKVKQTVKDTCFSFINKMVDYYETKNYVFVHGWIPLKRTYITDIEYTIKLNYYPEWRTGDWSEARWTNGIYYATEGQTIPDKTIVCGHWHCSEGHLYDALQDKNCDWNNISTAKNNYSPWYTKGCIAIDACTVISHKVNIIVLEDDLLEN
jgi:serine/threonine protein phosphatase 1